MPLPSVLLVSTDAAFIPKVRRVLAAIGYDIALAGSLEDARSRRTWHEFDAVLLQTDSPGSNLRSHLANGLRLQPRPPVMAVARSGSIRDAVVSIRAGAKDYLVANRMSPALVSAALKRAIEQSATGSLSYRSGNQRPFEGFITADHRVLEICEIVATVADSKATLLIEGESGTGKNLLARILHENSSRRKRPFIELNCGVLSDSLLESELFGHARGAFTSAYRERRGKFEVADGGTVLLDEVANATPSLQSRLLNAVETGRFERVGDLRTVTCDVRLVVASNVSLEARTQLGLFREDLYHRLDTLRVTLPPLRDRIGDIALLARHFLRDVAKQHGRSIEDFSTDAMERLVRYPWPGNVRELRNVVEHAVILTPEGMIQPQSLPDRVCDQAGSEISGSGLWEECTLKDALKEPEKQCILSALRLAGGNKQLAARELGISRSTLYKKIRQHRLDDVEAEPSTLMLGSIGTS